jgi:Amidohydrolase family
MQCIAHVPFSLPKLAELTFGFPSNRKMMTTQLSRLDRPGALAIYLRSEKRLFKIPIHIHSRSCAARIAVIIPGCLMARCTPKSPKFRFAAAGYTPLEAIVACTKENAFAVGLEDQVGMLVAGKLADVTILRKDTAADIRACKTLPISPWSSSTARK